jgi:hypothetical protein
MGRRTNVGLVKTVLDLTGETARHLSALEFLGFSCYGTGTSQEMLEIAANCLERSPLRLGLFHSFGIPGIVPFVTCFSTSLAQHRSLIELRKAPRNVRRNPTDRGPLVVDLRCTDALQSASAVAQSAGEGLRLSRACVGIRDRNAGVDPVDEDSVVSDGTSLEIMEAITCRGTCSAGEDLAC